MEASRPVPRHELAYASGDSRLMLGFVDGALITTIAILLAIRLNSAGIVLLGAFGGYMIPVLTLMPREPGGMDDLVVLVGDFAITARQLLIHDGGIQTDTSNWCIEDDLSIETASVVVLVSSWADPSQADRHGRQVWRVDQAEQADDKRVPAILRFIGQAIR